MDPKQTPRQRTHPEGDTAKTTSTTKYYKFLYESKLSTSTGGTAISASSDDSPFKEVDHKGASTVPAITVTEGDISPSKGIPQIMATSIKEDTTSLGHDSEHKQQTSIKDIKSKPHMPYNASFMQTSVENKCHKISLQEKSGREVKTAEATSTSKELRPITLALFSSECDTAEVTKPPPNAEHVEGDGNGVEPKANDPLPKDSLGERPRAERPKTLQTSKSDVGLEEDHRQFCQMVERMRQDLQRPTTQRVNRKGSLTQPGKRSTLSRFRPPSNLGLPHRKPAIKLGCRSPFVFTSSRTHLKANLAITEDDSTEDEHISDQDTGDTQDTHPTSQSPTCYTLQPISASSTMGTPRPPPRAHRGMTLASTNRQSNKTGKSWDPPRFSRSVSSEDGCFSDRDSFHQMVCIQKAEDTRKTDNHPPFKNCLLLGVRKTNDDLSAADQDDKKNHQTGSNCSRSRGSRTNSDDYNNNDVYIIENDNKSYTMGGSNRQQSHGHQLSNNIDTVTNRNDNSVINSDMSNKDNNNRKGSKNNTNNNTKNSTSTTSQLLNFRKPLTVLQRNIHQLSLRASSVSSSNNAKDGQRHAVQSPSDGDSSPISGAAPFASYPSLPSSTSSSFSPPIYNNTTNPCTTRGPSGLSLSCEDVSTKRRNFSTSSLPHGLMSSTIEEVDDCDVSSSRGLNFNSNSFPYQRQSQHQQQQHHRRQHSSMGNSTSGEDHCPHQSSSHASNNNVNLSSSTPIVSSRAYRTLRREPCIAGMNSPPKPHRTIISPLIRSASDNLSKASSSVALKDVDIVGESFESRYPWQRDVSIQCYLDNNDVRDYQQHYSNYHPYYHHHHHQPSHELLRSASSPATCPYTRSMSLSSNSPASSPPQPTRRLGFSHQNRSCSNSDLISYGYNSMSLSEDRTHSASSLSHINSAHHHQPCLNPRRSALPPSFSLDQQPCCTVCGGTGGGSCGAVDSNCSPPLFQTRRANFSRRPRPSSMGAVENIRYQHELTKFREMHKARGDRKSDPQLSPFSPVNCKKRGLTGSVDEQGSMSDLESILEYPGDRPWDISRHTSMTSVDFDDDLSRIVDSGVLGNTAPEVLEDYHKREDVLTSPRVSPKYWATFDEDGDISGSDDSACFAESGLSFRQKSVAQGKQPRRLSSGSITSDAESETTEPDLPVARRGRRAAIYETKNCGDVSPTTLSPEASPSNSCDEGEGATNIAERLRRRRSSVDLAMNIYPGDLLVQEHHKKLIKRNTIADFYASGKQANGSPLAGTPSGPEGNDASKKGKQPFSLLKLMKTRSKESLTKIDEVLKRLKPSEFKDNHLAAYKSLHWSDLIASSDKQTASSQVTNLSDTERKRREAVWELFKSECVFLIDHLMVLKHCFMEPLKKVQVEGSLMYAEPQDLFGNLDELSYVSYTFCKDFIAALLKDMSITDFGRTNVLLKAFQRFSAHSQDGAVFHSYCINYTNALAYLEKLRTNAEFGEFEKWCEQDPRCNRLQLTDLLVAPMQHCTKLPLLLHNVMKYTADEDERQQVAESIEKVEASLKQLEEKMRWIKNYERVQEVQRNIVWPTVTELDPRCVIPDCLKLTVSKQPCERLLTSPNRQLMYEGQVTLVETPKPLDVHMFLFDDILLITKIKKGQRKQKQSTTDLASLGQADKMASYVVLRQPLALDRFSLHDIGPTDASVNGLKHCFVLVQISRYQQITGVFTFQAPCEATKSTWLHQLKDAMEAYSKAHVIPQRETHNAKTTKNNHNHQNHQLQSNNNLLNSSINSALLREHENLAMTDCSSNNNGQQHNNNNNNVKKMERSFCGGGGGNDDGVSGGSNSLRGSNGRVPTKSRSMDAVYI